MGRTRLLLEAEMDVITCINEDCEGLFSTSMMAGILQSSFLADVEGVTQFECTECHVKMCVQVKLSGMKRSPVKKIWNFTPAPERLFTMSTLTGSVGIGGIARGATPPVRHVKWEVD